MIEEHEKDYKSGAWRQFSIEELGTWVHLLSKRATHRENPEKARKDLYDAKNYYWMMGERLKEIAKEIGVDYETHK